jgi:hypothetical protein
MGWDERMMWEDKEEYVGQRGNRGNGPGMRCEDGDRWKSGG